MGGIDVTKTKYIMSGGLAFAEQKDMEKLKRFAAKGWHVKDFAFMGYVLEQGEPKDVIYTIDHCKLGADNEEYFDLFTATNWEYIASSGDTHLFCGSPNAKPIYSDRETAVEKYKTLAKPLHVATLPTTMLTLLSWLITANTTNTLHTIFFVVSILITLLAIPLVWTTIAAYRLKWATEGKNGYIAVTKLIPITVLIAAIVILFKTDQNIFIVSASTLIGAIVFPALLSAGLSIYYKVKKA